MKSSLFRSFRPGGSGQWQIHPKQLPLLMTIGFLIGLLGTLILFAPRHDSGPPAPYAYSKLKAANGTVLHIMETTAEHIRLKPIKANVTELPNWGINGGFFWEGYLLSIAVVNDLPLKGQPGDYGSGWYNTGVEADLKRGTLVWDEVAKQFSVQVVTEAGELTVTDKRHYWAQGGVSMGLDKVRTWTKNLIPEQMPAYDEAHMRSGLVYDKQMNLYMIVTPTPCTIPQFREAIVEKLGNRGLVNGIFLDGDGSSQMKAKQVRLPGDHRPVYQMLAVE